MILKCLEFLGKIKNNNVESCGFKSVSSPLAIQEMTDFENDLQHMMKNIRVQTNKQQFSRKA